MATTFPCTIYVEFDDKGVRLMGIRHSGGVANMCMIQHVWLN